jgi:hypothetical protein
MQCALDFKHDSERPTAEAARRRKPFLLLATSAANDFLLRYNGHLNRLRLIFDVRVVVLVDAR